MISNFNSIGQIECWNDTQRNNDGKTEGETSSAGSWKFLNEIDKRYQIEFETTYQNRVGPHKRLFILPDGRCVLSCRTHNLVRFFKRDGTKIIKKK